jgi:hypothetical protein
MYNIARGTELPPWTIGAAGEAAAGVAGGGVMMTGWLEVPEAGAQSLIGG